jgi:hypothetical protein
MRLMSRRRTVNAFAAVLLLLTIGAVAMWIRSLFRIDEVSAWRVEVTSYPQQLFVSVWDFPEAFPVWESSPARFGPRWDDLVPKALYDAGRHIFIIPYWLIVLVTLPLPLFRLWAWWAQRNLRMRGFEVSRSSGKTMAQREFADTVSSTRH